MLTRHSTSTFANRGILLPEILPAAAAGHMGVHVSLVNSPWLSVQDIMNPCDFLHNVRICYGVVLFSTYYFLENPLLYEYMVLH